MQEQPATTYLPYSDASFSTRLLKRFTVDEQMAFKILQKLIF